MIAAKGHSSASLTMSSVIENSATIPIKDGRNLSPVENRGV